MLTVAKCGLTVAFSAELPPSGQVPTVHSVLHLLDVEEMHVGTFFGNYNEHTKDLSVKGNGPSPLPCVPTSESRHT